MRENKVTQSSSPHEDFIFWCRKHPHLWKAVKKHPEYAKRVEKIFFGVIEAQSANEKALSPR